MRRIFAILFFIFLPNIAHAQFGYPPTNSLRVKYNGTTLPNRPFLNFAGAGVSCADDPANQSDTCTINGGGGGAVTVSSPLTGSGTLVSPLACPSCVVLDPGAPQIGNISLAATKGVNASFLDFSGALTIGQNNATSISIGHTGSSINFYSKIDTDFTFGFANHVLQVADSMTANANGYNLSIYASRGGNSDNTASGGNGGSLAVNSGSGGSGGAAQLGGDGGDAFIQGGVGGNDLGGGAGNGGRGAFLGGQGADSTSGNRAGSGGEAGILAGRGGDSTSTGGGGNGANAIVSGGDGGQGSNLNTAGTGGGVQIASGAGGGNNGGGGANGGPIEVQAGPGSDALFNGPAGTGGSVQLSAGAGGRSSAIQTAADGGSIQITAGASGGNLAGGGHGQAGSITLDAGASTTSAKDGSILIGTNRAKAVQIGNATTGTNTQILGPLQMNSFYDLKAVSAPGAPSANTVRIYVLNAAGVLQLSVIYPDGTIHIIDSH